ncbi:MAG: rubrerythrin family protein [Thermodesulfobacteriota bacterium]|jgi:rubrerythrin|nr:MAG: rubrerythrin family protein [Thermodesulfobacteriota bacterium]
MATKENLKEAFAGESQANRKYLAFAKKAEADGYPQVAKLFRAAAEAETVHAHSHLRVLGGIKTTKENLAAAIEGEGFEFKEMYPKFISEAEKEGDKQALTTFKYANAVEEIHHQLYAEALAKLNTGNDLPAGDIHICGVCGYTVWGEVPENCPVCGSAKKVFRRID